ncbi:trypsin-1-like [Sitophilus oryzae]|uniref:Trypsin-1-like n=1 Tax=Sitophilus oryzae TaxID=7048 RepID=A0A6J2XJJ5_SITOR|nr:trypsin-1-like [Sitophilus oryzae]
MWFAIKYILLIFIIDFCCSKPKHKAWVSYYSKTKEQLKTGSSPANIVDHPYQILLLIDGQPKCGGSIIKSNFILTAAHCIFNIYPDQLLIKAGITDRTANGGQTEAVRRIIYPENEFIYDTFDSDIAILELFNHLDFNEKVSPIKLPRPGEEITQTEMSTATGWGMTDPHDDTLPTILQVVKLPLIGTAACRRYYGNYITDTMFCAGYEEGGKDTCSGDSGGPLVDTDGVLIGITSWGGDICASIGKPAVFTKVSYFTKYIIDIINDKSQ